MYILLLLRHQKHELHAFLIHSISKFKRLRSSPSFPRSGLEASFENLKMFWTYNLLRHLKHQSKFIIKSFEQLNIKTLCNKSLETSKT